MFGKKINNIMIKKLLFYCCLILLSIQSLAQNESELGDSILIYKYDNSNDYQLVKSIDSLEIFYYADSTIKAKGKYFKGVRNGIWTAYYPNGSIRTTGYITDSSFIGKWFFYYENGIRAAKGSFKHTIDDNDSTLLVLKMTGKWKFWNESGKLIQKSFYSPLRKNTESKYGKNKENYPSGKLKSSGEYHKGSKIGTWHFYFENGKKEHTAYYQYKSNVDYPIGTWLYWDERGLLIKKEIYKDGQLIETITY